eukprot:scaffold2299_cov131-Cylindrotheca_fusiformis.AAC.44
MVAIFLVKNNSNISIILKDYPAPPQLLGPRTEDSTVMITWCQVRIEKGLKPGREGGIFLTFAMTAKKDDRLSCHHGR